MCYRALQDKSWWFTALEKHSCLTLPATSHPELGDKTVELLKTRTSEWSPPHTHTYAHTLISVSTRKTEMCVNGREPSAMVEIQRDHFKSLGLTVEWNKERGKEVRKCLQAGRKGWRKVSAVMCDRVSAKWKERWTKPWWEQRYCLV